MVVTRRDKGDSILTRATDRIAQRYAGDLSCLPLGTPSREHLVLAFEALHQNGHFDLGQRLRVLRQLVFHRLFVLDCEHAAPLHTVMQGMTELAEFCIDQAVRSTRNALIAHHGIPLNKAGEPSPPAPIHNTEDCLSFFWPSFPISGRIICLT